MSGLLDGSFSRRDFFGIAGAYCSSLAAVSAFGCSGDPVYAGSSEGHNGSNRSQVFVSLPLECRPSDGFDPTKSWGFEPCLHRPLTHSTLMRLSDDHLPQGDLALSYECKEEGMVWLFRLREDALFSDGSSLTAEDVAFTINKALETNLAAGRALSKVRVAIAEDCWNLRLEMVKPDEDILYVLSALGIVPAKSYNSNYGSNPIGGGCYALTKWEKGTFAIFEHNPLYYGDEPKIKRVFVSFLGGSSSYSRTMTGALDFAYIPIVYDVKEFIVKEGEFVQPTAWEIKSRMPDGYKLRLFDSTALYGLSFPCMPAGSIIKAKRDPVKKGLVDNVEDGMLTAGNAVTNDEEIRRALNAVVDRNFLCPPELSDFYSPSYTGCEGLPWNEGDLGGLPRFEDVSRRLDNVGWTYREGSSWRSKDGKDAHIEIAYDQKDQAACFFANAVSSQAGMIGIHAIPVPCAPSSLSWERFSRPSIWSFESSLPSFLRKTVHSEGDLNYSGYRSEVVDNLIMKASASQSIDDMAECLEEALDVSSSNCPWAWLARASQVFYQRRNLVVPESALLVGSYGWSILDSVDSWFWK